VFLPAACNVGKRIPMVRFCGSPAQQSAADHCRSQLDSKKTALFLR
jgi:hypothetical protein